MLYLVKEDIYDETGRLLLRKGEIIKESTAEKLRKYKLSSRTIPSTEKNDPFTGKPFNKERFIKKFHIQSREIIDYPSMVLEKIIFNSKDKPWSLHIRLLSNYVNWLYTHSIDTALISLLIGTQLKYTETQLLSLGLGSLFHDIGKLLIPKEIVDFPGKLDDTKRAIMKQHCDLGAKSMQVYQLSDECSDIILHHHERLDGSGYPDGLTADEISLNCKIVMIADTIDAITSGRSYNTPSSMDVAFSTIRNSSEKFSQDILNIFTDLI